MNLMKWIHRCSHQLRTLVSAWLMIVCSFAWNQPLLSQDENEFFEKRIRPVLVEHCYACHSGDAKQLQGDLRLDLKAGWQRGGESGEPAIVAGKPDDSPLMRAVRHSGGASAMPPGKPKLADHILADLSEWIRRGAHDPRTGAIARDRSREWEAEFQRRLDWWSLRPVTHVAIPSSDSTWTRDPLDRFILRQLKRQQLEPANDADSLTLLRRLSFVLTGLPPTAELVRTFPEQYERSPDEALPALVDQLLESPHFGERFARHWMDVVRYSDTYGYEWDNPAKGSWQYRDYLIRAFNRDISFQQLIREQIAGDLLPVPRVDEATGFQESLIGPMFYHMGEHRHGDNEVINGVREEMIDNKVDAFSKAFLAMTIGCARCHDHKLDAVSQADYYALAGMFMMPRWTSRAIDSPTHQATSIAELQQLRQSIQQLTAKTWQQQAAGFSTGDAMALRQFVTKLNQAELAQAKFGELDWLFHQLLPPSRAILHKLTHLTATAADKGTKLELQGDGSLLASGAPPATDTYTVTFRSEPGTVDRLRLEALTHDSLGQRGPGRTAHGNFVLSHLRVSVRPLTAATGNSANPKTPAVPGDSQAIVLASARADYEQPNYPVADALNPDELRGWGVGLGGNVDRTAWFQFAKPIELPHGGEWTVTLEHRYGSQHTLGRFRIAVGMESSADLAGSDGLASDSVVASAWQRMANEWQTQNSQRREANSKFKLLTDLSKPELPPGFVVDGAGLHTGFTQGGEPLIALQGELAIERLLPRGFHTHAISSKLPGSLRLPRQEDLPGQHVSLALAGDEWSGFLRISDNAFQTENVTFLSQRQPTWFTWSDLAITNGIQRVAYEVATSDLNPNFPPRTGVARAGGKTLPPPDEGFEKRSWFSVTGIVSHDQPGQPQDELPHLASLFTGSAPTTAREAWQRVGQWLMQSTTNYQAGRVSAAELPQLNWLLSRGLLANRMADQPELRSLVQRYRAVEASLSHARTCNSMDERGTASLNYPINIRGDINRRGEKIPRDLPSFVRSVTAAEQQGTKLSESSTSGRLELADFLADPRHGLAARVYVNRVWQWVFGEAIVRTSNDFGHLGEAPANPELLDYLTRDFMADEWSTKRLVRRFVLSRTFRQSSRYSERAAAADPANRWLHHYPTRRLEAEAIRDSLIAVAGRLDRQLYGRPINPTRLVEDPAKRLFSGPLDSNGRRSIYLEVSIMDRSKFLQSFNSPDPKLPTGRRDETNAPAQALVMLNDPLVLAMASAWSERLVNDGSRTAAERLQAMFIQGLGRTAETDELTRWGKLLESLSKSDQIMSDREAWKHLAHTMFNLQEFTHYR